MNKNFFSLDDLPSINELSQEIQRLNEIEPLTSSSTTLQDKIESASSFITANIQLLELQDRELIKSTRSNLINFGLFSFVGPTLLSMSLSIYPRFQIFNNKFQILIRTSLYIPPLVLFYGYYQETSHKLCLFEVNKYYERILAYKKTNDRTFLNRNYEEEENY